jgi:hypothetical protein
MNVCVNCENEIILTNVWERCDKCNYFNKTTIKSLKNEFKEIKLFN